MIICVEGPDFSGKTTHSKMLRDYISENYPNTSVSYIHFPTTKTDNYMDLILKPKSGEEINNPMFIANAFMSDMYMRMNTRKETITINGEPIQMSINELNKQCSSKYIFIIDRYFYSTLIMCSLYNDNIYKELDDENKIKEYWRRIQGMISLMITQYDLPVPDLNIVLLPTWDSVTSRMVAAKRDNVDVFENKSFISRTYSAYIDALSYSTIFNISGEQLPPFIIRDTRVLYQPDSIKESNQDLSVKLLKRIVDTTDIQSLDSIQKDIRTIFDTYMDFRRDIASGKITGQEIEKFIEERGIKNEPLIYFSHEKEDEPAPSTNTAEETITEEKPKEEEPEAKETLFESEKENLVMNYVSTLDLEYVAEVKSMYEFDDTELYVYCTLGISIDTIISNPDKYILPSTYNLEERLLVLRIVLKMLASYKTEKDYPPNKVAQITRYVKSKFEVLTVQNKYGKKADSK